MLGQFRDFSGSIYHHPEVHVVVDDGRSYVRRSNDRYDIIQASLVDTWAATAAGAYTLTENTLYTEGGLRGLLRSPHRARDADDHAVGLRRTAAGARSHRRPAKAAGARPRSIWPSSSRIASRPFLFKKTAFTAEDVAAPARDGQPARLHECSTRRDRRDTGNDYAKLVLAPDRRAFYDRYHHDVRPTTDNRPFFFHTTKIQDQFQTAFGRSMLFGNGLSALMTLMAISVTFVALFVVGPLALSGSELRGSHWPRWLGYFGTLGAGFMLIEVALLQRFVLLLGHPVYSLTVTLFSILLGTGIGSLVEPPHQRRRAPPHHSARAARHRRCRHSRHRRAAAHHPLGDQRDPRRSASR